MEILRAVKDGLLELHEVEAVSSAFASVAERTREALAETLARRV